MFTLLYLLSLSAACSAAAIHDDVKQPFDWDKVKSVVAFGDSYTFVQGTYGWPGYSFIGSQLPGNFSFTPEQLLNDKINSTGGGTSAGGPNWVKYLTGCGLGPSVLTAPATCAVPLWDFAYAGADISVEHLPLHHNHSIQVVNQTQQFLTYALPTLTKKTCHRPSRALVAIWIGINDINDANRIYYNSSYTSFDFAGFFDRMIGTLFTDSVTPLYDAGYRDFLFINLPPLNRTPSNLKSTNPRPNATMIGWWDQTLERHARLFEEGHGEEGATGGVNAIVFDANRFLNGVLDRPGDYGIGNTTHVCAGAKDPEAETDSAKFGCSVPASQYFWYDAGHITSRVHEVMTEELVKYLKEKSF